ncbi:ABC transporter permease [Gemella massiliensis]|uniref:ABC transporter permease n=1 Tax=Gemella massiliensis TaxID=1909670 RepID=UPI000930B339|nr:FtsX-like permease family protein [Gemella massiliensis]
MRNLNKRIFRSLKKQWSKNLFLFILMISMISVTSGMLVASGSIKGLYYDLMSKGTVEDGKIVFAFDPTDEIMKSIEKENTKAEKTSYIDTKVKGITKGNNDKEIRIFKNRTTINIPVINEGTLATNKNEIVVNNLFAKNNNLKIGDTITFQKEFFKDGKEHTFKIVGLAALPDYNSAFQKNSDLLFNAIDFGVGLVSEEEKDIFNESKLKYQVSYRFNERNLNKKEIDEKNENILKSANKLKTVSEQITKKDNNAISYLIDDMGGDRPMMIAMLCLMVILIGFIFALSIVSKIQEESEIIGILLANGYKKSELVLNYIANSLIITFFAAILGNILGYTYFTNSFKEVYYKSYDLPSFTPTFNLEALIITTIIPISIILIFNYLYIYRKLNFSPLDFLRKNLKHYKNQAKAKSIKNFKIKKNFLGSFKKSVVKSNRGDYVAIILGIFITSILFIFGISAKPTFENYGNKLKENLMCNYQYILKTPTEIENKTAEKYTTISASVYHTIKKTDENILFLGISENSKYFENTKLPENKNEIVISEYLSKKLRKYVGDEITVKTKLLDKEKTYKIVDIYKKSSNLSAFVKKEFLNEEIEQEKNFFNGYFSNEKLNIDEKYIATTIDATTITDVSKQLYDVMGPLVNAFIFLSAIFLAGFMYSLMKIITDKNTVQIAYLKIFGYTDGEISKIYIRPITITILTSLIVLTPLEIYAVREITYYSMLKFSGYLELYISAKTVILSILITLLIYAFVSVLQFYKISKMNFSEVLKNRE